MKTNSSFLGLMLLLLSITFNANADLINIQDDVDIADYTEADSIVVALDVNPITSEYVVCYATFAIVSSDIRCKRYDVDDTELANIFLDSSTTDTLFDFDSIDVALNDAGEVYIMWTGADGLNIDTADSRAFVQGFDSDGNELFDVVQTANTDWLDSSFALSPSNFWVVGARETSSTIEIVAEFFTIAGVAEGVVSVQSDLYEPSDTCDRLVGIASNRSGDLVIAWVEPNSIQDTCGGSVFAQTYRESGSSISDATQLSDSDQDDNGDDISDYLEPVTTAYEDGEYVIAWTDNNNVYSANLLLDGSIASSQEELLAGTAPIIGGNSANQDYVVISQFTSGSTCTLIGRLAFDANIEPETTFSLGDCGFGQAVQFQADGKIILARTTTTTSDGKVVINRIDLPAEIEVSAVSVLEGSPLRGIQNVAVIDVSLTRAHPAGEDIEVSYFTRDSTALVGIDYTIAQGTLTFPAASSSLTQSFQVPIIPDTEFEDDEIFEVNLENAINAVLKNEGDEADITIIDDDSTPDITADCLNGNSNDCQMIDEPGAAGTSTEVVITLTMAESVDSDISVDFSTSDGTATAGSDYLSNSGELQFLAGSTQASIAITVLGDNESEDTETFDVNLSASSTVSLPDTTLTFSIINETLCSLGLEPVPNDVVVTSEGGSESFSVNSTLSDCEWEVEVTDTDGGDTIEWLTITSASLVGSGTVEFSVDPFDPPEGDPLARNANINVTLSATNDPFVDQTVTFEVGQDGDCTFTTDANSASFEVDGGTGMFSVIPNDESCEWSATSDVDWVIIDAPTEIFTGSGSVDYTVNDNAGDTNVENDTRTFDIISEEFTYSISQDGCAYSLDQNSIDVVAADNTATVNVLAPTSASGECSWTAVSNASWILISGGSSGSGGGEVSMTILDNASVESRVGSVTIGDETLTVNQSGEACDYSIDPESFSICPDGDTFDIDVTATDGCSWSLAEQDDWLDVLTNVTGIGSETASGIVQSNLSELDRSSSIDLQVTSRGSTVASAEFNQDGFLIYEPFEEGRPIDFVYIPDAGWVVSGTQLVGSFLNAGIGTSMEFSNACSDCKIEADALLTTASNISENGLILLGWYQNENNYVGLAMDEFANVWRLLQFVNGEVTMAESSAIEILPNTSYAMTMGFDGEFFFAEIDGVEVVQLEANAAVDPIGFAGFRLNDNNGIFSELRVTGSSAVFDNLFIDSFELTPQTNLAVDALSVCTQ